VRFIHILVGVLDGFVVELFRRKKGDFSQPVGVVSLIQVSLTSREECRNLPALLLEATSVSAYSDSETAMYSNRYSNNPPEEDLEELEVR
jgi:hypothetical protein